MPPYELLGLEHLFFTCGVGAIAVIVVALARGSRAWGFSTRPRTERELEEETHECGDGLSESNRPVPWLIWLVFIGYLAWAVAYVVFCGRHGV